MSRALGQSQTRKPRQMTLEPSFGQGDKMSVMAKDGPIWDQEYAKTQTLSKLSSN